MKACLWLSAILLCGCVGLEVDGHSAPNPDFLVIGHRGSPLKRAENTLPSLEQALADGANAVEVDLCVTKDHHVVLWHDRDPDETVAVGRQLGIERLLYVPSVPPLGSAARRRIEALTLEEFLASHGYARHVAGARDPSAEIPTLGQFAAWARAASGLRAIFLDVKLTEPANAELVFEKAAAALAPLGDRAVYFLSTDDEVVRILSQAASRAGLRDLRVVKDAEASGALAATLAHGLREVTVGMTPARTERDFLEEVDELVAARDSGVLDAVYAWTLDDRMQINLLLYLGVDGIITNDPEEAARCWAQTL